MSKCREIQDVQEESPLSPEDRSTVEDMADLVSFLNRVGAETERAEKAEQERRAKNSVV